MRFPAAFVLLIFVSCGTAQQPQTASAAPQTAAEPTAIPLPTPSPSPPPPAVLPSNPNQELNDQIARAVADKIAGRENEPAEKVFKNIQSLKGMPAERFVRVMNMGYSRALGVSCYHCHLGWDYSSDEKRPKRAAREMIDMNRMINEKLRSVQNLEGKPEEHVINCSTCHRGRIDPLAGPR